MLTNQIKTAARRAGGIASRAWHWPAQALAPLALLALSGCGDIELLNPKGAIGEQEKTLILLALGLMLLVVIPVMVLSVVFAWRYRETNTKATYAPKWSHSNRIEVVVWSIPCCIIIFLALLIWRTTHELDPYRPLVAKAEPVRVEVVALNWKWLFIYPDFGIASVNRLELPVDTPVNFTLTAQSMMNSFFIPQLGSQIYAMAGMRTQLHLIANQPGTYAGLSSAFSGEGFSDMHFDAVAVDRAGFDAWVAEAKAAPATLDADVYKALSAPSVKHPVTLYGTVESGLFDHIVDQFMPAMAFNDKLALCTAPRAPAQAQAQARALSTPKPASVTE
ncbi:ubiquinol oxidase subunit II [Nitrospirillum sp. BR 11828]|uniref:ubiquinol oxidase subunit II n=1 Tax=Nitrospirillum sp. BR 11828 TaxID=3104325 RepID=UPI002ACA1CA8|nr:ubiquinol oxidase subunit II [Nitrospirillum sp. BR 11828]MDZ5645798.1 ubiquinol oxidase subunit II [Nitrospirillum sp. BR 11828]